MEWQDADSRWHEVHDGNRSFGCLKHQYIMSGCVDCDNAVTLSDRVESRLPTPWARFPKVLSPKLKLNVNGTLRFEDPLGNFMSRLRFNGGGGGRFLDMHGPRQTGRKKFYPSSVHSLNILEK